MLNVNVYKDLADEDPLAIEDVDYVSLVSSGTYGKPALIAPGKPGDPRAAVGEIVLYVNTSFAPLFSIERVSD